MAKDLGLNDAKLAWGNWDYVDLSHFTKMPGASLKSTAAALLRELPNGGVVVGVASFTAGIALHRMRKSHKKPRHMVPQRVSPPQDVCEKALQSWWLHAFVKTAAAASLLFAARKMRGRRATSEPVREVKLQQVMQKEHTVKDSEISKSSESTQPPSSCTASVISSEKGVQEMNRIPGTKGIEGDGKISFPAMHFQRIRYEESPLSSCVPTRSPSPKPDRTRMSPKKQLEMDSSPRPASKELVESKEVKRGSEPAPATTSPRTPKSQKPEAKAPSGVNTAPAKPAIPKAKEKSAPQASKAMQPTFQSKSTPGSDRSQTPPGSKARPLSNPQKASTPGRPSKASPGRGAAPKMPIVMGGPGAPPIVMGGPGAPPVVMGGPGAPPVVMGGSGASNLPTMMRKAAVLPEQAKTPDGKTPEPVKPASDPKPEQPGTGASIPAAMPVAPKNGAYAAPAGRFPFPRDPRLPAHSDKQTGEPNSAPKSQGRRPFDARISRSALATGDPNDPLQPCPAPRAASATSPAPEGGRPPKVETPSPPVSKASPPKASLPKASPPKAHPLKASPPKASPAKALPKPGVPPLPLGVTQSKANEAEKKASEPSQPAKDEDYSFYSGSSRSSSQRGRSPSASSPSADEKPLSGRQWGMDFLPDISVQLEVKSEQKEAPGGCEFHVMHDDPVQGAPSLQQEYDQTLRRLGAGRAPAPGLQRQVTD